MVLRIREVIFAVFYLFLTRLNGWFIIVNTFIFSSTIYHYIIAIGRFIIPLHFKRREEWHNRQWLPLPRWNVQNNNKKLCCFLEKLYNRHLLWYLNGNTYLHLILTFSTFIFVNPSIRCICFESGYQK